MHISNLQSDLFGLIIEYSGISEHFKLLTTNKTIYTLFFDSYISQILDINNVLDILHKENLLNTIQKNKLIDNQKYNKFFIEINIKLLLKKINKVFIKNTHIIPILHMHFDKYNISIPLVISNPNIICLLNFLICRGDHLYTLSSYLPKIAHLYTETNKSLIDKLIYRGDHLYNISKYIIQLLQLYILDNKTLIDNLIYRGDYLYNILTYVPQLCTLNNRILINDLIYKGHQLSTIIMIVSNSI